MTLRLIFLSLVIAASAAAAPGYLTLSNRNASLDLVVALAKDNAGFGPWAVRVTCPKGSSLSVPVPQGKYRLQYALIAPGTDSASAGPFEFGSALEIGPTWTLSLHAVGSSNSIQVVYTELPFIEPMFHLWAIAFTFLVIAAAWLGYRIYNR